MIERGWEESAEWSSDDEYRKVSSSAGLNRMTLKEAIEVERRDITNKLLEAKI